MVTTQTSLPLAPFPPPFSFFNVRHAFRTRQICPALLLPCWSSGSVVVTVSFLEGSLKQACFGKGTKVQSKNFSICHQILESHLKEERLALRKENSSFLGIISAFLEKKKNRWCNIFQGRILSQMEEEPLRSRKGRPRGSEATAARGGAWVLRTSRFLVGGEGHLSVVAISTPSLAPRGPRWKRPRAPHSPSHRPSLSLRTHDVVGLRCL